MHDPSTHVDREKTRPLALSIKMADALRTWASCARRVGQLPHHFSVQVVGPCGQGGWVTRTLPPFVLRDRHWGTCCSFGRPSIELNLIRRPSAPLKLLFLKELVILKELVRLGVTASGALQAHMQRNGSRLSRPQRSLMALWLGLTGQSSRISSAHARFQNLECFKARAAFVSAQLYTGHRGTRENEAR